MRFALLGADELSVALARAAAEAGHEVVWHGDLANWPTDYLDARPDNDRAADWEDLVAPDAADAVLVGRGAADATVRLQQLQQLVRLSRPVLAVFPLFDSVLSFHEIELSRNDGDAPLRHFNPLVETGVVESIERWVGQSHPRLGAVEQILAERFTDQRSPAEVLRSFATDVELLDRVVGRLDRVGAHGPEENATSYAALSVQLSGPGKVPVRWSLQPPTGDAALRLSVICRQGRTTVEYDALQQPICIVTQHDADVQREPCGPDDPARRCIDAFCQTVSAGQGADASTWTSALHAMELADSIEISLRRDRMIDVHSQQLTEELAFRGAMSAIGCGVLLVLPTLLLLAGWIAGELGFGVARFWPHALLTVLAVFLAVQILPKLLLNDQSASDKALPSNAPTDGDE